jgi:hypothetical protein
MATCRCDKEVHVRDEVTTMGRVTKEIYTRNEATEYFGITLSRLDYYLRRTTFAVQHIGTRVYISAGTIL